MEHSEQGLSKEQKRAQEEAGKELSREEVLALRKQKKLEKQLAKQKNQKKDQNIVESQPIPTQPVIQAIEKKSDEPENVIEKPVEVVEQPSLASGAALSKEEKRAQEEAGKNLTKEQIQELRKQKKLEKQLAKQKKSVPNVNVNQSVDNNKNINEINKTIIPNTVINVDTKKEAIVNKDNNVNITKQVNNNVKKQLPKQQQKPQQQCNNKINNNNISKSVSTTQQSTENDLFGYPPVTPVMSSQQLVEEYSDGYPIHHKVIQYGLFLTRRLISGSNAHAQVLLKVLNMIIEDFHPKEQYLPELHAYLHAHWKFICKCKRPTAAMESVYNHILDILRRYNHHITESEALKLYREDIHSYQLQLECNAREISNIISQKIDNNDCILTYGMSDRILQALSQAKDQHHKSFRVIVVDSRPRDSSEEMVKELIKCNIQCSYISLNALPYIMNEVTKSIISASSMLNDGSAITISGGSLIALTCNQYNIPFLIACETYKFSNDIYLDSTVKNEVLNPSCLIPTNKDKWILEGYDDPTNPLHDNLTILALSYDLVPASFIMGVFTENSQNGIIPPSSVAFLCKDQ
ncbi:hypothetical protein WA158_001332 [Blastocystis sp. Blastoise]